MNIDPALTKRIMDTEDGKLLGAEIAKAILIVDSSADIDANGTNETIAREVRSRQHSVRFLTGLLSGLVLGRDSTLPTDIDKDEFKM